MSIVLVHQIFTFYPRIWHNSVRRIWGVMPEISRFLGIIIKMFFEDHAPPHFHVEYQGYKALFSIKTGKVIAGRFPKNSSTIVTAWALIHKKELMDNWKSLTTGKEAKKIEPLG